MAKIMQKYEKGAQALSFMQKKVKKISRSVIYLIPIQNNLRIFAAETIQHTTL